MDTKIGYKDIYRTNLDFAKVVEDILTNAYVSTPNKQKIFRLNDFLECDYQEMVDGFYRYFIKDHKTAFKINLLGAILGDLDIEKHFLTLLEENKAQFSNVQMKGELEIFANSWEYSQHIIKMLSHEYTLAYNAFLDFENTFSFEIKRDYRTRSEKISAIKQKLAPKLKAAINELEIENEQKNKEEALKNAQAIEHGKELKAAKAEFIDKLEEEKEGKQDESTSAYPVMQQIVKPVKKQNKRKSKKVQDNAAASLHSGGKAPETIVYSDKIQYKKIVNPPDVLEEKSLLKKFEAYENFVDIKLPTFEHLKNVCRAISTDANKITMAEKSGGSSHFNFGINNKIIPREICGCFKPHGDRDYYVEEEKDRIILQLNYMMENITGHSML